MTLAKKFLLLATLVALGGILWVVGLVYFSARPPYIESTSLESRTDGDIAEVFTVVNGHIEVDMEVLISGGGFPDVRDYLRSRKVAIKGQIMIIGGATYLTNVHQHEWTVQRYRIRIANPSGLGKRVGEEVTLRGTVTFEYSSDRSRISPLFWVE